MFESVEERAAKQALELAVGLALPVIARSLPAGQVRAKGCMLGLILLLLAAIGAAVVAALLIGARFEAEPRRTIIIVATLASAVLATLALIKGWRSRRADYVDPLLVV
jgi:hypothetical protein